MFFQFPTSVYFWAGTDGILLGAETLRGLYPVETIKTVGRICAEVELKIVISIFFHKIG